MLVRNNLKCLAVSVLARNSNVSPCYEGSNYDAYSKKILEAVQGFNCTVF